MADILEPVSNIHAVAAKIGADEASALGDALVAVANRP
jgi:hypothetical protein